MKKSLVLAALLVAGTSAMADMYIGADYGINFNTDKASGNYSGSQKNQYSDLNVKLGGGTDGNWKGQVRFSRISYDKVIFDDSNKILIEFGGDVIKEFNINRMRNVYPYAKFGLGYGSMTVKGYNKSSISEFSFNIGAGVSYKAAEHLYLVGGIDYVGRSWQDIEKEDGILTVTGSGFKPYCGVNYTF